MKILITLLLFTTFNLFAKTHDIKMLNKGSDGQKMVFEPAFLKIEVGDSVKFIPTAKGHSVNPMKDKKSRPEGVKKKAWKGKMNKELTVKIDKEGVYLYKCKPHLAMGMIGVVVAGKPINIDEVKKVKVRGKIGKKRATELLKKASEVK